MTAESDFVIFYSWQSDTGPDQGRQIRSALNFAVEQLSAKDEMGNPRIVLDEATRDSPGSPSISETIREKVRAADAFVADVTLVCACDGSGGDRQSPNPNVLFELGFAVAELGWERVVLLFDRERPMTAEQLPFDIRGQRTSPFSASDSQGLARLVQTAIGLIILKSPPRQNNSTTLPPDEVRRERDLRTLRSVLSCLDLDVIDRLLDQAPAIVISDAFHHLHSLEDVVCSSAFHIYDERARECVVALYSHWRELLSFGVHYTDLTSGDYKFKAHIGAPLTGSVDSDYKAMEVHAKEMRGALRRLVAVVNDDYLELDVRELSDLARRERLSFRSAQEWT